MSAVYGTNQLMLELGRAQSLFSDLLVLVAPWGVIPSYLAFTAEDPSHRPQMARNVTLAFVAILVAAYFGGALLLSSYGGIEAFRLVGSYIVIRFGNKMLDGQESTIKLDREDHIAMAMVPLAMPLLAGPGTISTIIIKQVGYVGTPLPFLTAFALLGLLTYATLRGAATLQHFFGPVIFRVVNSVTGLLTMSLGTSMLVQSMLHAFPGLAGIAAGR